MQSVTYKGITYPVKKEVSPNVSRTTRKKQGIVLHMTTSNNFDGSISWFKNPAAKVSALFVVGREVGKITMFNDPADKFWHAGRIHNPSNLFKKIALKTESGGYVNPNDYLDGIEFSGGVDEDKSGVVEQDEVSLTEWQMHCGRAIIRWHANYFEYQAAPEKIITHRDVTSYKPDMLAVAEDMRKFVFEPIKEITIYDKIVTAIKKIVAIITNYFNTKENMKNDLHPVLASSVNPQKLSTTIQGILIALVPVIISIFKSQDIEVSENVVVDFIQNATTALSMLLMLWGSVRKAIVSLKK